jgi:hypothetical protein
MTSKASTTNCLAFGIAALSMTPIGMSQAHAGLTLTVDTFTTSELKFSISGTFDSDVIGDQQDWLAIKHDWSNSTGINNDWLDDSLGFSEVAAAGWTIVENSITIGGAAPTQSNVAAAGQTWGDSIYFKNLNSNPILAGTAVSGSFHVQSANLFSVVQNLQLLSGFNGTTNSWVRLEANANVPAPASLGCLCIAASAFSRRRR